jgi:hypothetical protein
MDLNSDHSFANNGGVVARRHLDLKILEGRVGDPSLVTEPLGKIVGALGPRVKETLRWGAGNPALEVQGQSARLSVESGADGGTGRVIKDIDPPRDARKRNSRAIRPRGSK